MEWKLGLHSGFREQSFQIRGSFWESTYGEDLRILGPLFMRTPIEWNTKTAATALFKVCG